MTVACSNVSAASAQVVSQTESTKQFKSFADWCLKKSTLPVSTRQTINVLLKRSRTLDCYQSSEILSSLTTLDLSDSKIADLSPLQVLTTL
ncbi:MAG TPA: hypothetical protein V6C98_13475, partial [Thermosynechococcaceae cyanobacterium]